MAHGGPICVNCSWEIVGPESKTICDWCKWRLNAVNTHSVKYQEKVKSCWELAFPGSRRGYSIDRHFRHAENIMRRSTSEQLQGKATWVFNRKGQVKPPKKRVSIVGGDGSAAIAKMIFATFAVQDSARPLLVIHSISW